jgi:hypothetical protein
MKPESTPHDDSLIKRIRAKRSQIAMYLNRVEPTANRLTTFATI